jgi:fructokinase
VQIVSLGEVLWDVFDRNEFLGGAPLNFAANAQRLGNNVALLTAVGADERGTRALAEMKTLGLTTEFVQTDRDHATGTAIVHIDGEGNASYVIDRPAAFDCLHVDDALLAQLAALKPDWIYYGTLAQAREENEAILERIVKRIPEAKCFFDLNLRKGHWNLPLVHRLSTLATILKLNEDEAELLSTLTLGEGSFNLETFCRHWSHTHGMKTICVTLGSKGCAVFYGDRLETYEGIKVNVVDTVGAGDAFAAAFLHGFELGWPMERTAKFANAVGGLVASRAGATPAWTIEEALR